MKKSKFWNFSVNKPYVFSNLNPVPKLSETCHLAEPILKMMEKIVV